MNDKKETPLSQKYRCPGESSTYRRVWRKLLPVVTKHEKFKEADILRLETLCELYEEKEKLQATLDVVGYTYDQIDAKGVISIRTRPEVQILARVQANILQYSKSLGLLLKETKEANSDDEVKDEWA